MRSQAIRWSFLSTLLLSSALLCPAAVQADDAPQPGDWTRWRGPNSSGATIGGPTLASTYPAEGPPKLWETYLADESACWGSPSAADGRAYLMIMAWQYPVTAEKLAALKDLNVPAEALADLKAHGVYGFHEDAWLRKFKIPADQKKPIFAALGKPVSIDRLACLDANTGKILWQNDYPMEKAWGPEGGNRGTAGTPCLYHGRVYVSLSQSAIYCLDAKTGHEIWTAKGGGGYTSVVVDDGVLVAMGTPLLALNADTGAELWHGPATGRDYSPALWHHDGKTCVIYDTTGNGERLHCKELATGKDVWTCDAHGQTVAVEGDYMAALIKGPAGHHGSLAIFKLAGAKPEKTFDMDIVDVSGCPILWKGFVYYVACGRAVCIEAKTSTIKWDQPIEVSARLDVKGNSYSGQSLIWSSPIIADGKLFTALDQAKGAHTNGSGFEPIGIFDANPEKFQALGVAQTRMVGCTSPTVAGTKLFVHTATGMACFDLAPK